MAARKVVRRAVQWDGSVALSAAKWAVLRVASMAARSAVLDLRWVGS
jgi:hypothetical protein